MSNAVNDGALSRNPATGEELARYPYDDAAALEKALVRSQRAFTQWRTTPLSERAAQLTRIAQALRQQAESLAQMMTREMGKPIVQARAEVEKSASLCDWYAEHGPAMLAPQATQVPDNKAVVAYRPLGTVLAVMPWNFPLWQVLRGAVPAILGGNPYLLKHAPNVMGSAKLIEKVLLDAGLPDGVFSAINVTNDGVSAAIADARIATVAVTGSVRAGQAIAEQAGRALKKSVLELGGADAFIVLNDADLDEAVKAAVVGRFQNSGQVCIAAKRIIVEAGVAATFEAKFIAAVQALKVGDPQDEETYIGPMARADLRDELHAQVQASLAEGARLVLGGEKLPGPGNYYAPTVLADVTPAMTAFRQELFGPVASLIVARDAEHAVELANDSDFGLGGTIWSADESTALEMAARLETGGVFINGYTASDPRVPIGGVKKSGYGRELSSFGLHEFCNVQTVWRDRR
ncbi:aldehyde dehydrogenase family protein [Pantoea sp. 1.19]|uniref:aldehyde dehydrogenase family protein n=1 Tax=Pantoea sp. 1.19 TaxID=1925589 RepID=UPI000948EB18|nr:aldehyde dehydrogenase family protein [Pantoea sp. 1.19]